MSRFKVAPKSGSSSSFRNVLAVCPGNGWTSIQRTRESLDRVVNCLERSYTLTYASRNPGESETVYRIPPCQEICIRNPPRTTRTRPIPEASQDLLVKHYSPETPGIVEAELVTLAPLGVFPNAGSPKDLKAALLRYASEYPDNWRDNVLEVGRATDWTAERIGECLTDIYEI